jgi:NAD(P)-dependent dehydrogenase (short-subunit alcohol dehydrogenase family)
MRNLTGKVAVITGGAGGIGKAVALECATAGMDVVLADLDEPGMRDVATEITSLGRRALCVPTDVRSADAVQALLDRTLAEMGGCQLMVNNAGVFHAAALIDTSAAQYQRIIDINIGGVVNGSRIFGAHFVRQGEGHLVNTASAAGLFPVAGMSAYSLTKFAIFGYSLQLRWEFASSGVGVSVLCPGTVNTGIAMREGVGFKLEEAKKLMKGAPDARGLARKVVRAIRRNRPLVRYGSDAYIISLLRLLPMWLVDPLGRFFSRMALKIVKTARIATLPDVDAKPRAAEEQRAT